MAATMKPPKAGPTARAILKATLLSETADGSSSRETNSGITACHTGAFKAAPKPRAKVRINKSQEVTTPINVSSASAAAANIQLCVTSNKRRRSTISASAPAGSANKKSGALSAVCINATMKGVGAKFVINHSAPTFCIHVPTFEATDAIHKARNKGCDKGLHADTCLTSS